MISWIDVVKKYTIVPILLFLFIILSIVSENFLSPLNLRNIVFQSTLFGVMGVGMTFLMINGYFDLSVGTVMGLSAALAVGLQPYGLFVSVIAALANGVIFGLINGLLVTKAKLNAFVVTLAAMQGARGLLYIYTKENTLTGIYPEFADFAANSFGGIPILTWIMLSMIVIGEFTLRKSMHGRNTYATGGNESAAKNAGINTDRTTITNFILCSLAASIAGVLMAARMNSAMPSLGYPDTNLMIIACVVLGGTKITGGYGGMLYTLGGVITIGIIQNGLNLLNVQTYYAQVIMGTILILIILMDAQIKPFIARRMSINMSTNK